MQQVTRTALPLFNPESPAETARMGHLVRAQTGLHLIGVLPDGRAILSNDPTELPAVEVHIAESQGTEEKTLSAARMKGAAERLDLVRWNRDASEVTYARLMPLARDLRSLFAGERFPLHRVEVYPVFSADEARLESVITRLPLKELSADRRASALADIAALIPGYTSGWTMTEDTWTGLITFAHGVEERLPDTVPLADIMPERYAPDEWAFSAFGKDVNGQPAGHNLNVAPHVALAGETGGGKTYCINAMLASRRARGHRLLIVDPSKALDFPWARDYALAIAETYPEAHAAMRWVQEENERRKAVLKKYDAPKWGELTAEQRAEHDIYPLTVIADELATALTPWKVSSTLQKGTAEHARQVALSEAKNALDSGLNEIAATMRAVGIYGIFATQKMLATAFGENGSTLRSNSGNKVYIHLHSKKSANVADLRLLFDTSSDADEAADAVSRLNQKGVYGMAVTVASGRVEGIRVANAVGKDIPPLFASLGVPKETNPLNLSAAPVATPAASAAPAPSAAPAAWQ